MKSSEIKDAYKAVKADAELKEKLRLMAEEVNEDNSVLSEYPDEIIITERKGGKARKLLNAVCALAAVMAVVFAVRVMRTDDVVYPDPADGSSYSAEGITESVEPEPLPPNTAEVTVKVVDLNGVFVKNRRVDYAPIQKIEVSDEGQVRTEVIFDEEKADQRGTIPMTYNESTVIRLEYGDYAFYVSGAFANDTVAYDQSSAAHGYINFEGMSGNIGVPSTCQLVTVDETTKEIVLRSTDGYSTGKPMYSQGEIIIRDSDGMPIPDCTVILKPKDGVYKEGYTDTYGGYVLPRTDEEGSSIWHNPIEGEYTVIAYREKLHPSDEPITDPVIIDGDDSYSYAVKESVFRTYKIYTEAKGEN